MTNQNQRILFNKVLRELMRSLYRFRAELLCDIAAVPLPRKAICVTTTDPLYMDTEVLLLAPSHTRAGVRNHLRVVDDGHVMVESLNYAKIYTGNRWYFEDEEI